MRKQKVYISGPMTGIVDNNYPAFNEAEDVLLDMGYEVINPASNTIPEPPTWASFMRIAIPQLCECDIICLLHGWGDSKGAKLEAEIGAHLGLEIVLMKEFVENKEEVKE